MPPARRETWSMLVGAGQNAASTALAPYAASDAYLGLAVAESLLENELPGRSERRSRAGGEALPGRFEVREGWGARGAGRGAQRRGGCGGAGGRARSYPGPSPGGGLRVLREKDVAGMLSGFVGEAHVIVLSVPGGEGSPWRGTARARPP